jgi:hypothetical protein
MHQVSSNISIAAAKNILVTHWLRNIKLTYSLIFNNTDL